MCVETTGTVCYIQMLYVPVVHRGRGIIVFPQPDTGLFLFFKSGLNGFEEKNL